MKLSEKILKLIEKKGVTPYEVSIKSGVSESTISRILSGNTSKLSIKTADLLAKYFNVSSDSFNEVSELTELNSNPTSNENFLLVPLYSQDVVGGMNNQEMDTNGYVTGYMPFVNAKQDDICVPVTNDSMSPIYEPGTVVQIRKLEHWREFVEFGKVHIIELNDDRRLIKIIRKGNDSSRFILKSENPKYDDADISIDFIRSVWLVLAKYQKVVM